MRRLPPILAFVFALAAFLLLAPVGLAMALLRSSPDAAGPDLAAQLLIAALVVGLVATAGAIGWGVGRLVRRLFGGTR